MKLQVGVKALIKNDKGALLFLRRSTQLVTDSKETSWDIPGGRIDPGEQLLDALRREIQEETGFDTMAVPQLIAAQDIIIPTKDLHVVRLTYMMDAAPTEIKLSSEHDDFRWVMPDELDSIAVEPFLAEVLKSL